MIFRNQLEQRHYTKKIFILYGKDKIGGFGTVVERSTVDGEVRGSNPTMT